MPGRRNRDLSNAVLGVRRGCAGCSTEIRQRRSGRHRAPKRPAPETTEPEKNEPEKNEPEKNEVVSVGAAEPEGVDGSAEPEDAERPVEAPVAED